MKEQTSIDQQLIMEDLATFREAANDVPDVGELAYRFIHALPIGKDVYQEHVIVELVWAARTSTMDNLLMLMESLRRYKKTNQHFVDMCEERIEIELRVYVPHRLPNFLKIRAGTDA